MRGWGNNAGLDLRAVDPKFFDRLWAKIDKTTGPMFGRSRCWVWHLGSNDKPPTWSIPGIGVRQAHQVVYALAHDGILPADLVMVKECETRRCVRHWKPYTSERAGQVIALRGARRKFPVDELRRRRKEGAGCAELAKEFPELTHYQIRELAANRHAPDPKYKAPPRGPRRKEHPELCTHPDLVEAVRAAHAAGHKLTDIAFAACLPFTTVWEIVNGPSSMARREKAS